MSAEEIIATFPLLAEVKDAQLRDLVVRIWQRSLEESSWCTLADCPFGPEAPDVRLVDHINLVTESALVLGRAQVRWGEGKLPLDEDKLIAASLVHDVSKPVEFAPGPKPFQRSPLGEVLQHAVYGAHLALELGFPQDIVAIIVNHTAHSRVVSDTAEGVLIFYADMLATDFCRLSRGRRLHVADAKVVPPKDH